MLLALVMTAAATVVATTPVPPWPPAPKLEEAAKDALKGVGNEPFWSIAIDSPKMILVEPGDDGDKVTEFAIEYSTQLGADAHVWTSGPLTVTVSSGPCSDTMSDTVYPYAVDVSLNREHGDTFKGCAYRPWGQDIAAAIPVIDACLKANSIQPPIVYAGATAPDAGFVMFAGSDLDPLQSCTVGAGKATIAPYPSDEPQPPGVNAEVFVRGTGGENPGGECYDAPEVKDADGKQLGWWLDPEGC